MRIAFLGDCVIQTPQQHSLGPGLKRLLDDCDYQAINFEAPVWFEGAEGIDKSGPVVHQCVDTPQWLEQNGFNIISFANNHMYDLKEEGIKITESLFKRSVLVGYGDYSSAHKAKFIETKEGKVGFIGVTHKEFGCVDSLFPSRLGTADINSPNTFVELASALKECDRVFVLAHAGVEYQDFPLPKWKELYHSFIDMGASGVIASHPHVPQGYELYNGKPIFYSLGNFAFQKPQDFKYPLRWNSSLLVCIDTVSNDFQWFPLKYDVNTREIEIDNDPDSTKHIQEISKVLQNGQKYKEAVEQTIDNISDLYCYMAIMGGLKNQSLKAKIKNFIKPLLGRKRFHPCHLHALNLFQCESHRWIMEKIIQTKRFYK